MKTFLAALLLAFAAAAEPVQMIRANGLALAPTPACGASPCTVQATSTVILAANSMRGQCLLQNTSTAVFYCNHGTSTATASRYDFILKAASGATVGDGGTYSCAQAPGIWRGALTCLPSVGTSTLAVSSGQ